MRSTFHWFGQIMVWSSRRSTSRYISAALAAQYRVLIVATLLVARNGAGLAAKEVFPASNPQLLSHESVILAAWLDGRDSGVVMGLVSDQASPATPIRVSFFVGDERGGPEEVAGYAVTQLSKRDETHDEVLHTRQKFVFIIPDRWRDGAPHQLFIRLDRRGTREAGTVTPERDLQFRLDPSFKLNMVQTNLECIPPNSRCPSIDSGVERLGAPTTVGWSDGKNYFDLWNCTSDGSIDTIHRLNILPLEAISSYFQKDSLSVNWTDMAGDSPVVYFTATNNNRAPRWRLKKAVFETQRDRWEVFSVLNSFDSIGGVSSQDGQRSDIILNSYLLAGWGPASPVSGSLTRVPGVAVDGVGVNPPLYPLVGTGPLGLTTLTSIPDPDRSTNGVEERTCIHMNPKLLDYSENGIPDMMVVNLWQDNPQRPCILPGGDLVRRLPNAGNYVYRYAGPALGWQLDLSRGLVTDSVHHDTSNRLLLTPKLLEGTARTLVIASWSGVVISVDLDKSEPNNTSLILDCRLKNVHFGEGTGRPGGLFFLATSSDVDAERRVFNLAPDVIPTDIFYGFRRKNDSVTPDL